MSVTTALYLVDWQTLEGGFAEHDTSDFFYRALENDEPWLASPEAEYVESWRWARELGEVYAKARPRLDPEIEKVLSTFLFGLGIVIEDGPEVTMFPTVRDLNVTEAVWEEHFLSLNPRSVDRFLKLAVRLPEDGGRRVLAEAWSQPPLAPSPRPVPKRMQEMRAALEKIRQTKPKDAEMLDRLFERVRGESASPPAPEPVDDPDSTSKILAALVGNYRRILEEARHGGRGLVASAA